MLRHELLEHVLLFLLVTRGLALSLHLLIVHHLLDHSASIAIQIRQLGVLWCNLGSIDLRSAGDDVGPPIRVGSLRQRNDNVFAVVGS
jgi:hypothetical protein